jgi:hypothetical protein
MQDVEIKQYQSVMNRGYFIPNTFNKFNDFLIYSNTDISTDYNLAIEICENRFFNTFGLYDVNKPSNDLILLTLQVRFSSPARQLQGTFNDLCKSVYEYSINNLSKFPIYIMGYHKTFNIHYNKLYKLASYNNINLQDFLFRIRTAYNYERIHKILNNRSDEIIPFLKNNLKACNLICSFYARFGQLDILKKSKKYSFCLDNIDRYYIYGIGVLNEDIRYDVYCNHLYSKLTSGEINMSPITDVYSFRENSKSKTTRKTLRDIKEQKCYCEQFVSVYNVNKDSLPTYCNVKNNNFNKKCPDLVIANKDKHPSFVRKYPVIFEKQDIDDIKKGAKQIIIKENFSVKEKLLRHCFNISKKYMDNCVLFEPIRSIDNGFIDDIIDYINNDIAWKIKYVMFKYSKFIYDTINKDFDELPQFRKDKVIKLCKHILDKNLFKYVKHRYQNDIYLKCVDIVLRYI